MTTTLPRVFRTTGTLKIVSAIAMVLMGVAGGYLALFDASNLYRAVGAGLALFGVAGFIDVLISRIVLEEHTIHIVSLVRRRSYARREFESAKVDGGAVALKKRSGGWLLLPDTGANALAVRNTIHAWIKAGGVDGKEDE